MNNNDVYVYSCALVKLLVIDLIMISKASRYERASLRHKREEFVTGVKFKFKSLALSLICK